MVVLESGRVLGGDSIMAYVGDYAVDGGTLRARVRSWTWNFEVGETTNVFGMDGPVDYHAIFEGDMNDGAIIGWVWPEGAPESPLAAKMQKIAKLP